MYFWRYIKYIQKGDIRKEINMLTSFGKFLRILRINNGEILKDMADKLNVSVSFLSAVENGKKEVPSLWEEKIADIYNLNSTEKEELTEAILKSKKEVKISLQKLDDQDKDIVLEFARKFSDLDQQTKQNIMKYLVHK